jgi:hypothetical protein
VEGAKRTLEQLVARMRAEGLHRLEITDTDPPVVIVSAELARELDRMVDEQAADLADYGHALDNLTGQLDLSQALPVEEAIAELQAERTARESAEPSDARHPSVADIAELRARRAAARHGQPPDTEGTPAPD